MRTALRAAAAWRALCTCATRSEPNFLAVATRRGLSCTRGWLRHLGRKQAGSAFSQLAQPSASWLSSGSFQREILYEILSQAARSLGQPRPASASLGQSAARVALAGHARACSRHRMPPRRQQRLGTRVVVVEHGVRAGQCQRHPVGEEGVHVRLPASASASASASATARWQANSGSGSRVVGVGVARCCARRQARRWHGLRSSGVGAPRFRSGRPSSTARGAPLRRAVAESSRRLRPNRRQPTRLPPTRRARRARQRCGWRRSQAPGASHDCCGCAAAAVAPLRCGCAGCSAAPALLHGQFARVSPRRADQTVARACSGATESGDCCSSGVGQPR